MMLQFKQFKGLLSVLLISLSMTVTAEDLNHLYTLAKTNDPTLQAAKETEAIALEALPLARAGLLPILSGSASSTYTNSTNPLLLRYNTHSYGLALSQPLFDLSAWHSFRQADEQTKSAVATYIAATQDLITRVIDQYFSILKAHDDLDFAKAERKAFARALEQAQQRFQVGLIAITDVHEAQARHDNAFAQEITAKNKLQDEKEKMREIVDQKILAIHPLSLKMKLSKPNPSKIEDWVQMALEQNLELQAKRFDLEAAKKNLDAQRAGHYPTIQFTSNLTHAKGTPPTQRKSTTRDVGVSLTVPILNGGATSSRTRSAARQYDLVVRQLDLLKRQVESETRQAYRGVLTKISQIKALEQAVVSSTSALEATQAAFEVGTRTIVDVLNAQSDLLNAKRNFTKARYDYIIDTLNLKKFAGILSETDVQSTNAFLQTNRKV